MVARLFFLAPCRSVIEIEKRTGDNKFSVAKEFQKEGPVLDVHGAPLMKGHPPHQYMEKKFYKTTNTINALIE
jgi:hypothetical protein